MKDPIATSTVDTGAGAKPAMATPVLFIAPQRSFFLAGAAQLVAISVWRAWTLAARAWPELPSPRAAVPDTALHALPMIAGFAPGLGRGDRAVVREVRAGLLATARRRSTRIAFPSTAAHD